MLDWLYRTFWANVLRKALTVCGAAVVLGGAAFAVLQVLETLDRCAAGVERSEGECVGVNGSGYDFGTSEISAVSRAIAEENDRVAKKPHITVALMLPLQPTHEAGRQQLRSDVQGAYLAQYRANRQEKSPRLRLVLANPGSGYEQQEKVVDRLAELADSPEDNLRAVTGFNLSLASTKDAMERLTNELEIPVLASRVSADELANPEDGEQRFNGLARVIPTNRQQAAALADFYGDLKDQETVLVKDTRPGDIYVRSLAEAFGRDESGPPGAKDQEFRSPGVTEKGDTGNDFSLIGHNICNSEAETVYFAGRPTHLRLFALKLAEVPCAGKKYTVVSGSGAATLDRYMSERDWEKLARGGSRQSTVRVQYVAPTHPDAWEAELRSVREDGGEQADEKADGSAPTEQPGYLTEPLRELRELRKVVDSTRGDIGPVQLEDSRTILVYDGVRAIAEAVFLANAQTSEDIPSRNRIAAMWSRLESAHRVVGASGWICLTNGGNPYDKPVAVVELDPRSRGLSYVGLAWPEGEPQPAECVVPSRSD